MNVISIAVTTSVVLGAVIVVALQYWQFRGQHELWRLAIETQRQSATQTRESMAALIDAVKALQQTGPTTLPETAAPVEARAVQPEVAPELTDRKIVQELTHSLRTPLHAIRYETEAIELTHPDDETLSEQSRQVGRFVDTCDVILSVFGQLVDAARRTERLRDLSLPEAIKTLHAAAEAVQNRGSRLTLLSVPNAIVDYPNAYLSALLMPLVENAVEASEVAGEITVEFQPEPGYVTLRITNAVPEGARLPPAGTSTKHPGPGLGLKVAERLADMHRGGKVEISLDGDRALVVVRLPDTRGQA